MNDFVLLKIGKSKQEDFWHERQKAEQRKQAVRSGSTRQRRLLQPKTWFQHSPSE